MPSGYQAKLGSVKRIPGPLDSLALKIWSTLNNKQIGLSVSGSLINFGVDQGQGLALLGLMRDSLEWVLGIDSFKDQTGDQANEPKAEEVASPSRALKNYLMVVGDTQQVIIWETESKTLSTDTLVGQSQFTQSRWIYFNGEETSALAQHELLIACPTLGSGGVFVLEGFEDSKRPEISDAILTFLNSEEGFHYVPFWVDQTRAYFTHAQYAETFKKTLLQDPELRSHDAQDRVDQLNQDLIGSANK